MLYIGLFFAYFYWAESGEYGPTFTEWLSDWWWFVVYMAVLVIGQLLFQHRSNVDAWNTLTANYGSDLDEVGSRGDYPAAQGTLAVDSENLDVIVIASEIGIFITRDDGRHVHLPWERVERLVFSASRPRRAKVHFSRNAMNPLEFDLPWHENLMKEIPDEVRVETFE